MSLRFFVDQPLTLAQPTVSLAGTEGQHLVKVMRAQVGDRVILFDGAGHEYLAELSAVERKAAELRLVERRDVDRERRSPLRLAVALPKGDRQRVLIEKAVETGVTELIPIWTARSSDHFSEKSLERWRRYVIDASKQCGRNRLMTLASPQSLSECLQRHATEKWIAHPGVSLSEIGQRAISASAGGDADSRDDPRELDASTGREATNHETLEREEQDALLAIGPEGGFTEEEVQCAYERGWQRLDLGPRILRIETAAVVAVSRFPE